LKVEEESFLQQFSGLRGEAVLGGGIDGIASATYSSRGVVEAVNLALQLYQSQIAGGDVR
jgi:uncharacterized protein with FMN-binding domain